ncbi:uncharacterized protein LOC133186841 [Saccostrea echinata]|uniref:uncharacterized protein LOC133186841 n=1 Tax=Saccostrea echinata TaxID=191078 RepID=UPI002A80397F|nr:uncharacterized protein LOC133186841 [Saccostrea echinata]
MVKSCCVYKCRNVCNGESRSKGVSFFRFPKNKRKRRAWIKAVNRDKWTPNEHTWICSQHFVDGWHGDEPSDDNYAPTIFAYKQKRSEEDFNREQRRLDRETTKEKLCSERINRERESANLEFSLLAHGSYCRSTDESGDHSTEGNALTRLSDHDENGPTDDVDIKLTCDAGVQCEEDPLLKENRNLKEEVRRLREDLRKHKWSAERIKDDDGMTRFYTGLPSFTIFLWLYNYLSSKCSRMTYWRGEGQTSTTDRVRMSSSCLHPIDQLFAVLMRLKVGLYVQDISERFQISSASFSMYFTTWISLIHAELKFLNPFPSRDIINRTMPESFKSKYPSTRVIIDCTELFIQSSSSLINQSLTFSNYKHHTTVKFLVGISPSGVITFVSDAWPGKTSDRQLTEECGLLQLLEPSDSVMADKGFTIADLLEKRQCSLNIPPFRGTSNQFSTDEVFKTQEIAQLRIHVERSIGRVKNFHVLEGVIPLTMVHFITKIFQVCCWLTNLDYPLVDGKKISTDES